MSDNELKQVLDSMLDKDNGQNEPSAARVALFKELNKLLGETANQAAKPVPAKAQPKVVRDSFTLPETDYNLMHQLQDRALELRIRATKGEVLRAGLHALENLPDDAFLQVMKSVEKLKPGRRKE